MYFAYFHRFYKKNSSPVHSIESGMPSARPNKGIKDWRKLSRFLVLVWLKRAKTPYDKAPCEQRLQFRCVR